MCYLVWLDGGFKNYCLNGEYLSDVTLTKIQNGLLLQGRLRLNLFSIYFAKFEVPIWYQGAKRARGENGLVYKL